MDKIPRTIFGELQASLFKGKLIMLYGARATGKTTLLTQLAEAFDGRSTFINCSDTDDCQNFLQDTYTKSLKFSGRELLILDDAHHIDNVGLILRDLAAAYPSVQIIASGSLFLFDLDNDQNIPLIAGKKRLYLFPLSVQEAGYKLEDLERWLLFGFNPSVMGHNDPCGVLRKLIRPSLYEAALNRYPVRGKRKLHELLQVLAARVGDELSFNDLGEQLNLDKITVSKYVSLFEDCGIIFQLRPLKRKLQNELSKLRKVYFYDLGIRNALIDYFAPLQLRPDTEALWENFFIAERQKHLRNHNRLVNAFFWRTYEGTSLDYLEEESSNITVFDCKLRPQNWRIPTSFTRAYPASQLHQVNQHNYKDFM